MPPRFSIMTAQQPQDIWHITQDDFNRLAKIVILCDTPEAMKLKQWGDHIRSRGPIQQAGELAKFEGIIPCPKCGAPTWYQLSDGLPTLFCYSASCHWKQHLGPEHDAAIAAKVRKEVLDKCCKQCPIKEEIPVEDYCAESCEGCLVRTVCAESLRSEVKKG